MAERFNKSGLGIGAEGGDRGAQTVVGSAKRLTVFIKNYYCKHHHLGEVAERFNAAVLKTVVGASLPGVRISPSPPFHEKHKRIFFYFFDIFKTSRMCPKENKGFFFDASQFTIAVIGILKTCKMWSNLHLAIWQFAFF